jgi:CheY-like chemotaxis protein
MKVLIVDDKADMRLLIRDTLGPLYDIIEAGSGREALRLIGKDKPHLMLLDVGMPRMDGHEVLRAARRIDPNLRVIMLTADASIATARAALLGGAVSYITKPFEPETLRAQVFHTAEAVSARGARRSDRPWRVAGPANSK